MAKVYLWKHRCSSEFRPRDVTWEHRLLASLSHLTRAPAARPEAGHLPVPVNFIGFISPDPIVLYPRRHEQLLELRRVDRLGVVAQAASERHIFETRIGIQGVRV